MHDVRVHQLRWPHLNMIGLGSSLFESRSPTSFSAEKNMSDDRKVWNRSEPGQMHPSSWETACDRI